jgi:SAM-dependent methyltransferase
MNNGESMLGLAYRRIYDGICGRHPHLRPWHFQWLAGLGLYGQLRKILPTLDGRVLDVGCGSKPYKSWFRQVPEYVGLDVFPGSEVDVVVSPNESWPLADEYFDVLLSSQVLEHVEHLELTLAEMSRVLKRGGVMVMSFPFLYNEHGAPYDFQRFTAHRAAKLFPDFEVLLLKRQGGIGSTITILFLNWIEMNMNGSFVTRLVKAALLPAWLLISLVLNFIGLLVDSIDRTDACYSNLLLVLRKPVKMQE